MKYFQNFIGCYFASFTKIHAAFDKPVVYGLKRFGADPMFFQRGWDAQRTEKKFGFLNGQIDSSPWVMFQMRSPYWSSLPRFSLRITFISAG